MAWRIKLPIKPAPVLHIPKGYAFMVGGVPFDLDKLGGWALVNKFRFLHFALNWGLMLAIWRNWFSSTNVKIGIFKGIASHGVFSLGANAFFVIKSFFLQGWSWALGLWLWGASSDDWFFGADGSFFHAGRR